MSELHYFPLLAADWLAGEAVSMMTPEQEGAFIHLLCYAWQSSGVPCSLPNDDATLAHLSRLGKRWAKVGAFVKAQFDVMPDDPSRLRNAKLWAIFSDASVKHERRVNAGKTGGIAKAERKQSASNATPMLEHSSSNGASNALAKASNQNQSQNHIEATAGADAPLPRIRVVHPPWVQEGVDWWVLNVGATTPAKFSKALSSSVALLSWERLFPDLRDWAAEKVRNKKPLKPEWYAEIASGRLSPKPEMVDKFGVLTEYGERMTRPVSA